MAKILLIEPDNDIREFIKMNFQRNNFIIIEAKNGEEATKIALLEKPNIVILDIMLPDIDGLQICNKLRNIFPDIGIIILSAKDKDIDKIMGLQYGADDYVVKPFNITELILRVKSLLRRMGEYDKKEQSKLQYGEFILDLYSKIILKNGKKIELTPKEFFLLKIFMSNAGKIFSRNELLNSVWGIDFLGDPKIVDVNIRRLRSKIEDDSTQSKYIETVWGVGYRWKSKN